MNFKCVAVPLIPDPRGVDLPIQTLQQSLGTISWMEFAFGKAFTKKGVSGTGFRNVPKVYQRKKEFLSVEPTDEVAAFCFFEIAGDQIITNYRARDFNFNVEVDVSLIVWANLKRIDDTRDYIFSEELKDDVIDKINKNASFHQLNSIEMGVEKAFSSWTVATDDRFYAENFVALKFNMTLTFEPPCYEPADYNLNNC